MIDVVLMSNSVSWSDSDKDKDYCHDQVGEATFVSIPWNFV